MDGEAVELKPQYNQTVHLGALKSAPGGFSVHDALGRHVSTAYFDGFVEIGARYTVRINRHTYIYILTTGGAFEYQGEAD